MQKILKQLQIPNHLTYHWETCMQFKKQQLELNMEQWTGSKLGKEYEEAVYWHPAYAECIMRNAGLDAAQAEIKIAGRNVNNPRYADIFKSLSQVQFLQPQGL